MKHRKYGKKKKYASVAFGILFVLLMILSLLWFMGRDFSPDVEESTCEFHFVDVGQGDSSLFMTDSAAVMIDAGPRSESFETAAYVASHTGVVDYLILTHPDEDHIGGAVDVINTVNVKNIIMTDAVKDTYSFSKLLSTIEKSRINTIKAVAGNQFSAGGMKITLLAPLGEFDDYNDYSIVTRIEYGSVSAIVTGDAEQKSESLMLKKYGDSLKTDILKLAHHGSSTSTGIDFLEATNPDFAVISCGKDNDYGHPHREILDLLSDFGIETHRTDKEGSIVFVTDGEKIQYKK